MHEAMIGRPCRPDVRVLKQGLSDPLGDYVEFKLTYEGQLLGASRSSSRAEHKHEIRRVFHRQLRELWKVYPYLNVGMEQFNYNEAFDDAFQAGKEGREMRKWPTLLEWLAQNYTRCGYRFVPLLTKNMSASCSVKILFLRTDFPGAILRSGDIDNRLKTLFDALRMVNSVDELGGYRTPGYGEDPFFCLLEDDSLIDHLSVETDTLLQPISPDRDLDVNDARLVISVRLRPTHGLNRINMRFG